MDMDRLSALASVGLRPATATVDHHSPTDTCITAVNYILRRLVNKQEG